MAVENIAEIVETTQAQTELKPGLKAAESLCRLFLETYHVLERFEHVVFAMERILFVKALRRTPLEEEVNYQHMIKFADDSQLGMLLSLQMLEEAHIRIRERGNRHYPTFCNANNPNISRQPMYEEMAKREDVFFEYYYENPELPENNLKPKFQSIYDPEVQEIFDR